ncbi:hypothetical protein GCM10009759_29810 [Kitasatospora saccharophila]|uniref:YD repeat-containing protein n=1 Tax=Kitasatospora saccharophila TaxID=407973 RepID=A0ABN2WW92_9ACTN
MPERWEPQEGQAAYDQQSGQVVRVMSVHGFGAFVRPLKGGRESIAKLCDLIPPEQRTEQP